MKTLKINRWMDISKDFTGTVEFPSGSILCIKNGKRHRDDGPAAILFDGREEWWFEGERHREDGPAVEYSDGAKFYYLEGKRYYRINLQNHVVLDSYRGEYGITWYKLLDKDKIFEYPDIPGLITK